MNTDTRTKQKKDCILCKLTGSIGLFGISTYLFYNSTKITNKLNKNFVNAIATGISNKKKQASSFLYINGFHLIIIKNKYTENILD